MWKRDVQTHGQHKYGELIDMRTFERLQGARYDRGLSSCTHATRTRLRLEECSLSAHVPIAAILQRTRLRTCQESGNSVRAGFSMQSRVHWMRGAVGTALTM